MRGGCAEFCVNGVSVDSQYASVDRLLWQRDDVAGKRITNVDLSGSLVTELSRPLTGKTTTLSDPHTDVGLTIRPGDGTNTAARALA